MYTTGRGRDAETWCPIQKHLSLAPGRVATPG